MNYEEFYQPHVSGFKSNGKQAYGRCPFHDDKLASFSMNLFTGQFKCHGCQVIGNHITFARRIGVTAPIVSRDYIASPSHPAASSQARTSHSGPAASEKAAGTNEPRPPSNLVATYEYQYEDGAPATRVLRYEPKSFRQKRWNGQSWIWSLEGARRVPYRLPKILATAGPIYLVEGEKDVETLEKHGLTATTTPMGAASWSKEYAQYFAGKYVVALPDNDEPGRGYSRSAARDIRAVDGHVKLVELPGLPDKGDVSDYLNGVGTVAELQALVKATPAFAEFSPSHLEPVDYFRQKGVDPYPSGSYLPSEYKAACRQVWNGFIQTVGSLSQIVADKIEAADKVWAVCTSKKEYDEFLKYLKEAHELSLVEQ